MPGRDNGPGSDHNTSALRRNGFVIAGGFLVLVLVLAAAVVMSDGSSKPASPAVRPSAGPRAQAATSGCHPTDTSQQVPSAPPPGVTWQVYNAVAYPFSVTAGPMVGESGGIARCYAHTPLGALLAVSHIPDRMAVAPDWRKVVTTQVLPGPGREAFIHKRSEFTGSTDFAPGEAAQIAGFRFVTYTPATAVVQMVTRGAQGVMRSFTFTVMWSDGDWKLQLQPNGDPWPVQDIGSLDGFVVWGGV
jgi:hypothetical protein